MRILLDVTRTLVHSKKSTPTGIDRVEHAYIRYLLAHRTTQDVFFLANTPYGRGVLPADDMADLFAGIERTHQNVQGLRRAIPLQSCSGCSPSPSRQNAHRR